MKRGIVKPLLLIVLLLLAIVLGKAAGGVCAEIPFLSWLSMAARFGLAPATLDLAVASLTFGLEVNLNVAQGILLLLAILTYIKIKVKE